MGISVGLTPPQLSAPNKRAMKVWLREQLASEELASGNPIPVQGLAIYINGEVKLVMHSYWQAIDLQPVAVTGRQTLQVGAYRAGNHNPTKPERLAVLGGIIGAVGLWDELTADFSKAVGRVVLEAYNSCFHDMIAAPQPAVVLAFSSDKQKVAVQYRDDPVFYQSNGEGITVDDSWQRVSA